jgi:hypothetical protein
MLYPYRRKGRTEYWGKKKCDADANRKQHDEGKVACSKISEGRKENHSTLWNLII